MSFARYWADWAREQVAQAISKYSETGDRLVKIQSRQADIAIIQADFVFEQPQKANYEGVPMSPPAIRAEVEPLIISVSPGSITMDYRPVTLSMNYVPGTIKGQVVPVGRTLDISV